MANRITSGNQLKATIIINEKNLQQMHPKLNYLSTSIECAGSKNFKWHNKYSLLSKKLVNLSVLGNRILSF